MLHEQQELKFQKHERVTLKVTDKGRQWLYDDAALKNKNSPESSARTYLKWLDALIVGEKVDLRREARGDIHLVSARVLGNTVTKVIVVIDEDTRLPGGIRFERGEKIVISKNIDILIAGARRLAPVGGE